MQQDHNGTKVLLIDLDRTEMHGVNTRQACIMTELVRECLSDNGRYNLLDDGPFACGPGFHEEGWTIAYEGWGGDVEWPFVFTEWLHNLRMEVLTGETDTNDELDAVKGIMAEPCTGWSITLWRE